MHHRPRLSPCFGSNKGFKSSSLLPKQAGGLGPWCPKSGCPLFSAMGSFQELHGWNQHEKPIKMIYNMSLPEPNQLICSQAGVEPGFLSYRLIQIIKDYFLAFDQHNLKLHVFLLISNTLPQWTEWVVLQWSKLETPARSYSLMLMCTLLSYMILKDFG